MEHAYVLKSTGAFWGGIRLRTASNLFENFLGHTVPSKLTKFSSTSNNTGDDKSSMIFDIHNITGITLDCHAKKMTNFSMVQRIITIGHNNLKKILEMCV